DSGIRARFGYGDGFPVVHHALTHDDLSAARAWLDEHGDGRVDLGIAIHSPVAIAEEFAAARALGLPTIATHVDYSNHLDLLGPDVLFTHGAGASPDLIGLVA